VDNIILFSLIALFALTLLVAWYLHKAYSRMETIEESVTLLFKRERQRELSELNKQ